MPNRQIRAGVIGLMYGRYGILPALQANPAVNVVALCSRNLEFCRATAQSHGVPDSYVSWRTMLDEAALDLVAIAVDPQASGPMCAYALGHGTAVFAEKLPSASSTETGALADQAQSSGIAACVDYIFPQLSTFQAAHKTLHAGELGRVRLVTLDWVMESHDHRHGIDSWKTDVARGGGVLQHFLVHALHYLEWLCGPFESVSGALRPREAGSRSDAFATLCLRFCNGTLATVNASNAVPGATRHALTIWGDNGKLELHNNEADPVRGFALRVQCGEKPEVAIRETDFIRLAPDLDSRVAPTGSLIDALIAHMQHGGTANFPDLRNAQRVHQLAEAIMLSNSSNKAVYVNQS